MRSEYSANNGNDDWLVTPPIHFLPGRQYIIKFNIRNAATNWVNSFEVKYGEGDNPAQFTKTLQPTFEPKGDDFETRTYYLTFDEEVTYRFGFHDNTAEATATGCSWTTSASRRVRCPRRPQPWKTWR